MCLVSFSTFRCNPGLSASPSLPESDLELLQHRRRPSGFVLAVVCAAGGAKRQLSCAPRKATGSGTNRGLGEHGNDQCHYGFVLLMLNEAMETC